MPMRWGIEAYQDAKPDSQEGRMVLEMKDAQNGMLRYTVRFVFSMGNNGTTEFKLKAFKADLLLRYASDSKKYVYDIVNIKEDTATVNGILEKEARRGGTKAASQSDVFIDKLSQSPENVNRKHSDRDPALFRCFDLAKNAQYAFSSKNDPHR